MSQKRKTKRSQVFYKAVALNLANNIAMELLMRVDGLKCSYKINIFILQRLPITLDPPLSKEANKLSFGGRQSLGFDKTVTPY